MKTPAPICVEVAKLSVEISIPVGAKLVTVKVPKGTGKT